MSSPTIHVSAPSPSQENRPKKERNILKLLGPGLVTGAAGDDPSRIATCSQAGAQFGFTTLWTMLFSYPLMSAMQMISAQIGRVTGHGIAGNMRQICPPWFCGTLVAALILVNVVNIAANVLAMGAAVTLVVGGPAPVYGVALSIGSLLLQVYLPYSRYVKVLKWLCLALFSYVATAFIVKVPWRTALAYTFIPHLEISPEFLTMIAAILGTTISPYLLFWQASQEVEEVRINKDARPLAKDPSHASIHFGRIEVDTRVGMAISNLVAYFIILTAAVTLHSSGTTELHSAADAAQALKPVAGTFAFVLFALGIIGTGLLALPVLAGSAAYGLAEALGWRSSLEVHPVRAKRFYFTLVVIMVAGTALIFIPIDPMKALVWAAVLNGVIAPPLMATMMMIAGNRELMKSFVLPPRLKAIGWIATATMTAVAALTVGGWLSR